MCRILVSSQGIIFSQKVPVPFSPASIYCSPQRTAVKSASGDFLLKGSEILNNRVGYLEQLCKAGTPACELIRGGIAPVIASPLTSCDPPDLGEITSAEKQLRD